MSRPASVTAVAVLGILGSLFTLLMAAVTGGLMFVQLPGMPEQPSLMRQAFVLNAGLFLALSVWGIVTAVGLLRMKRWARISTLIFSGGLVCFALLGLLSLFLIPLAVPPGMVDSIMRGVLVGVGIFYGMLLAVSIWWLVLFNRAAIKAQFYGGTLPVEPFPVPLSITTIAWFLLTTCVFFPFMVFTDWPIAFLAWVVMGWQAKLLYLIYGMAGVAAGYGLLRRRIWAYWLTLGYVGFGVANAVAFYAVPGSQERLQELIPGMIPPEMDFATPSISPLAGILFGLLGGGLLFYFLVTRKKRYEEACRAAETTRPSSAGGTAAK